jgi:hypothetical protein
MTDDRLRLLQDQRADALNTIKVIDGGQLETTRTVRAVYVRVAAQLAELIAQYGQDDAQRGQRRSPPSRHDCGRDTNRAHRNRRD